MCVKSEFPNVSLFVDDSFGFFWLGVGCVRVGSVLSVLSGQLSLSQGGSFDQSFSCR